MIGFKADEDFSFEMPWYDRYGLFSVDFIFDRFIPVNVAAKTVKLVLMTLFTLLYALPFGLWLTIFGRLGNWLKWKYLWWSRVS